MKDMSVTNNKKISLLRMNSNDINVLLKTKLLINED